MTTDRPITQFPSHIIVNGKAIPVDWLRLDSKVISLVIGGAKTEREIYTTTSGTPIDITKEDKRDVMREVWIPVPPPNMLTPDIMRYIYDNELQMSDDGGQTFSKMTEQDRIDFNVPIDTAENALGKFSQQGVQAKVQNEFTKRGKIDLMNNPKVQNYIQTLTDYLSNGQQVDFDKAFLNMEQAVNPLTPTTEQAMQGIFRTTAPTTTGTYNPYQYGDAELGAGSNVVPGNKSGGFPGKFETKSAELEYTINRLSEMAVQAQRDIESGKLDPLNPRDVQQQTQYGALQAYKNALSEFQQIGMGKKPNSPLYNPEEPSPAQLAKKARWAQLVKQAKLASSQPQKVVTL